mgnify:FL=1
MFDDCGDSVDKINFKYYYKLNIYLEYIKTNNINVNDINDLFEICLFIEDVDIEHLANYFINNIHKFKPFNEPNEIILIFNYIELFYSNNLMKQYYQLISKVYPYFKGDDFINYLKKTRTNSDTVKFYMDTMEHIISKKYVKKYIN